MTVPRENLLLFCQGSRSLVMSARVLALVLALRTGNQVVRVEAALSFGQIAEEENSRLALLASHNNIPITISKFGGHGGTLLLSGLRTSRRLMNRRPSSQL